MTSNLLFIITSLLLILTAGICCFGNFKNLKKALYWWIYPDFISIWSKKKWEEDTRYTLKMIIFVLVCVAILYFNHRLIFVHSGP